MQVPRNMQVPHEEVHERVSSILKNRGFCPGEEVIFSLSGLIKKN